jgi:hypothetical protein
LIIGAKPTYTKGVIIAYIKVSPMNGIKITNEVDVATPSVIPNSGNKKERTHQIRPVDANTPAPKINCLIVLIAF